MEELRHLGGGEENDSLGEFGVGELVVGKQTKDMRKLIPSGRKDSVVLGNVSVDGGIFRDAVNEDVVLVQDLAGDLLNGLGDGGGEHERLSLWSWRHHPHNTFYVLSETHIQ